MNKATKILAGLLLFAALLIGVYALMLARQPAPAPLPTVQAVQPSPINQYSVVVAIRALDAGKPIPADAIRVEKLPIKPVNSFDNLADVAGKVAVTDVGEGAPLVQAHLSGGLATQVAAGERAVAINIDEAIAVGYRIKPGDFVDVFFFLKQDNSEIAPSQSRLLLSKLRVLATGSNSVNEDAAKVENRGPARTVVLAVPVAEVNKLTLSQHAGRLTLALRNPKDDDIPSESLYPVPPPILQAGSFKPGSTDVASGKLLTTALANEPVNQAFAGVSLPGLSAKKDGAVATSVYRGRSSVPVPVDRVEIIRGGVRQ